jgi:hypothetical protein
MNFPTVLNDLQCLCASSHYTVVLSSPSTFKEVLRAVSCNLGADVGVNEADCTEAMASGAPQAALQEVFDIFF